MTISDRYKTAQNASATSEIPVPIITVEHPNLSSPERFVADTVELTHGGNTYQPLAFSLQWPDDEDQGVPVFRWVGDNVDQNFSRLLRLVGSELDVEIKEVLVSTPDVVERGPFNLQMKVAEYDALTASGPLTIDPILEEPFSKLNITPVTYPAEF